MISNRISAGPDILIPESINGCYTHISITIWVSARGPLVRATSKMVAAMLSKGPQEKDRSSPEQSQDPASLRTVTMLAPERRDP
jgi:hypothetical protein